jgi:pilus assembly protein CpaE
MSDVIDYNERTLMAFVMDQDSETVLREALPSAHIKATYRRGGLKNAIAEMSENSSPNILIVDISDCEPDNSVVPSLEALAEKVQPSTIVLAVGTNREIDFYRQITQGMGAAEYIYKPITRPHVANHFTPIINSETSSAATRNAERGGRVIAVIGAKGGVGTSMIATHLTRYIGNIARRHVMLIDGNFRHPACCNYLGVASVATSELRQVLDAPNHIDSLYVKRASVTVDERISLLMADDNAGPDKEVKATAGEKLINILKMHHNMIVIDMTANGRMPETDFLKMANHKIIVMDPNIVSLKEAHKILNLENGPFEPQRPTVVLNRAGVKGGLTLEHLTKTGEMKIDLTIPDFGPQALENLNMGRDMMEKIVPFKNAIRDLAKEIGVVDTTMKPTKSGGLFSFLKG